MLERISEACSTCQLFSPKPQSFHLGILESMVFNQEISVDLKFLENLPVLHVVDSQPHFKSSIFVRAQISEDVLRGFLQCCSCIYAVYPEKARVDQGICGTDKY